MRAKKRAKPVAKPPPKPSRWQCEGRHDLGVLGEFAVYPGHPVTLALVIVRTHDSYAQAASMSEGFAWPHAVGCSAVPGAGGNVHSAMDLLARWKNGIALEDTFARADLLWEGCDGQKQGGGSFAKDDAGREKFINRWREGQDQADRFKPALIEALKTWPKE
jgi:hypothetical protein